jgi:Ca2+-binding RTX toxin-like protein
MATILDRNLDALELASGIVSADVALTRWGDELRVTIVSTGETLIATDWFADSGNRIEELHFADGTIWGLLDILSRVGTDDHDIVNGAADADLLVGGAGDDSIYGLDGGDVLVGGEGFDYLEGGRGSDVYRFALGDGFDTINAFSEDGTAQDVLELAVLPGQVSVYRSAKDLYIGLSETGEQITILNWFDGAAHQLHHIAFADGTIWDAAAILSGLAAATDGDDAVFGTAGADVLAGLAGSDAIYGLNGDDVLDGGAGEDYLEGGNGRDVYRFGIGSQTDLINAFSDSAVAQDVLELGVNPGEVIVSRGIEDLYIELAATGELVIIQRWFNGSAYQLDHVLFADGTTWDAGTLEALLPTAQPTESGDWLWGGSGGDVINALDGDDFIAGVGGNDSLYGGLGNDVLEGGYGDDALDGGEGDDYLYGGFGNDVYVFGYGYGSDWIEEQFDQTPGNHDVVRMAAGVAPEEVTVTTDGFSVFLWLSGGKDRIGISGWLIYPEYRIEAVEFADGTVWDVETIFAKLSGAQGPSMILGTPSADLLQGTSASDRIEGLGDDDVVFAGEGADKVLGWSGDDTLYGEAGNDDLSGGEDGDFLSGGEGNDTLHGDSGDDVLDGGEGRDVLIGGTGNDTYIIDDELDVISELAGEGDDLVSSSIDYRLGANLERLELRGSARFGGGNAAANIITGNKADNRLEGAEGDDTLSGLQGNDILVGGMGADTLLGGEGDDVLRGGEGDDTLDGGEGSDTYRFALGFGNDYLTDFDAEGDDVDSVVFEAGIDAGAVSLEKIGQNVVVTIAGHADRLTIDWQRQEGAGIEQMRFADGTVWDRAMIEGMIAPANLAPVVADGVPDVRVNENAFFSFKLSEGAFIDPNPQDVLTYAVQLEDGSPLPEWLSFDAHTRTLSGAPGGAQIGPLSLIAVATDAGGLSAVDAFLLTVQDIDNAPRVLQPIGDQSALEGTSFSLRVADYFTDDDGDTLTFFARSGGAALPKWLSFDAVSGLLKGVRGSEEVGQLVLEVGASDGSGNSTTATFNLVLPRSGDLTLAGTSGADILQGRSGDDLINGLAGNDLLQGGAGNDRLNGGSGADRLEGGSGEDALLMSSDGTWGSGWVALNVGSPGNPGSGDTASISGRLQSHDTFVGGAGIDTVVGTDGAEALFLDDPTNPSYGGPGPRLVDIEIIRMGGGDDVLDMSSERYAYGNVTVYGGSGRDVLWTSAGDDVLYGESGDDWLDGGLGFDQLYGGDGNDTYVIDDADEIFEAPGGGIDTVRSSLSYMLDADLENLMLTGTAAINGTGNTLNNVITGNRGDNRLDGGGGSDTMKGGAGNDTYVVDSSSDIVIEECDEGIDTVESSITYALDDHLENLVLTGSAAINGTGNGLDNIITGNSANNTLAGGDGDDRLVGGGGSDTMKGGDGDDTYVVDSSGDTVIEYSDCGVDTVESYITYTLGSNVENLTLMGSAAIDGTGNGQANVLRGNDGANRLAGGGGNDTYYVGAGDTVVENSSSGTDTVYSSVSFTLSNNVENLTLTGSTHIDATGNSLANLLTGNSGNNRLNGGGGADVMKGGGGDDTYVVDNSGDAVSESANAGTDTVESSITYTLGANLENLILTGTSAINGTGNSLDNVITGNSGNNTLTGGAGNDRLVGGGGSDTMKGGTGDDAYVVDSSGDSVVENWNEGFDTVESSINYTLGSNVERLLLTGTSAINGTGNSSNNVLAGNGAANTLSGGSGDDLVSGGAGNDTLKGDSGADILEGGDGDDNLSDSGGNGLYSGGAGNDGLTGNSGNELFAGGAGNDTIVTGAGNDVIAFNRGDGQDTVISGGGGSKTLSLGGALDYSDLTLKKSGNDLILSTGNDEQIALKDWYASGANRNVTCLQVVSDAMAAYDPNSSNALLNSKVQQFDFTELVRYFDKARVQDSTLTQWQMMDSLLTAHLASSNSAALGGNLAYQYGHAGTLAGIGLSVAQNELKASQFGNDTQSLQPEDALKQGAIRLG